MDFIAIGSSDSGGAVGTGREKKTWVRWSKWITHLVEIHGNGRAGKLIKRRNEGRVKGSSRLLKAVHLRPVNFRRNPRIRGRHQVCLKRHVR